MRTLTPTDKTPPYDHASYVYLAMIAAEDMVATPAERVWIKVDANTGESQRCEDDDPARIGWLSASAGKGRPCAVVIKRMGYAETGFGNIILE